MTETLTISNFACLSHVEIETGKLTVLIGPQASGKSIIAKMLFLLREFLREPIWSAEAGTSQQDLSNELGAKFVDWFPPTTWRSGTFRISLKAHGDDLVWVTRSAGAQTVDVQFAPAILEAYEALKASYRKALSEFGDEIEIGERFTRFFLPLLRDYRESIREKTAHEAGWNNFIPSGRSLFTSLARTSLTYDPRSQVDPVTAEFGRRITALRDQKPFERTLKSIPDSAWALMGGRVVLQDSSQVLITDDGREIPIHLTSSGQQELFPLLLALGDAVNPGLPGTIFIEEPEAHLFPKAQNDLMEYLMRIVRLHAGSQTLFITTHSPYCLSKINNLMKAGSLVSEHPEFETLVAKIVDPALWIMPSEAKVYGLADSTSHSLVMADGLINAEYLDSASADLTSEFSSLLGVEFSDA